MLSAECAWGMYVGSGGRGGGRGVEGGARRVPSACVWR